LSEIKEPETKVVYKIENKRIAAAPIKVTKKKRILIFKALIVETKKGNTNFIKNHSNEETKICAAAYGKASNKGTIIKKIKCFNLKIEE